MRSPVAASPTTQGIPLPQTLRHVAIIMDGNRRWAKHKLLPGAAGHARGVDSLKEIVTLASDSGLEALTVYAFSTENWNRGQDEVGFLLKLFLQALAKELDELHAKRVRIRFIGDLSVFPTELKDLLNGAMEKTAPNTGLCFQVAVNYGSRAELTQAVRNLARQVQQGSLDPEAITESLLSETLYTHGIPDPDLLIRTGGESRLSNYLLWQCAYTEFYVTPVLWPDFNRAEFEKAVLSFAKRERRFGV